MSKVSTGSELQSEMQFLAARWKTTIGAGRIDSRLAGSRMSARWNSTPAGDLLRNAVGDRLSMPTTRMPSEQAVGELLP